MGKYGKKMVAFKYSHRNASNAKGIEILYGDGSTRCESFVYEDMAPLVDGYTPEFIDFTPFERELMKPDHPSIQKLNAHMKEILNDRPVVSV
jgi:hypothetical protein